MGGRYLVTGVQLGMLMADDIDPNKKEDISIKRNELIQKIIDEQFIGPSNNSIKEDCKKITNLFCKN